MNPAKLNACCRIENGQKLGSFRRSSDGRTIKRYRCKTCKKYFSQASFDAAFRQKKRHLNHSIMISMASLNSTRRAAMMFNVNVKTIVRKTRFLSALIAARQVINLQRFEGVDEVQFDELQSIEHSKCKPLSVAMAVCKKKRKILGFKIASMPATGHLAKISVKKYGFRPDERREKLSALFKELAPHLVSKIQISSDQCSFYKQAVQRYFPNATYQQFKGEKSSIAGQGELKKVKKDPLFAINHTFAMLRANVNRLIRRTWCTSKKVSGLHDHLLIYMWVHNRFLTA